jgi:hypothetical protein
MVVSVMNDTVGSAQSEMYTGITPFSTLLRGTGTTLYLPAFPYDFVSYNARVFFQNTGNFATDVTATFYDQTGGGGTPCGNPITLEPWGQGVLDAADCGFSEWKLGALRLTADQPLAAVAEERFEDGPRQAAYNAFSAGARELYAPLLMRDFIVPGWDSAIHFHDVSGNGGGNTITVYYYDRDGHNLCAGFAPDHDTAVLAQNGWGALWQGDDAQHTCLGNLPPSQWGYAFAARMYSANDFVAVVNVELPGTENDFLAYNTLPAAQKTLVFPFIRSEDRSAPPAQRLWDSNIIVQNASGNANHVPVKFYDKDGGEPRWESSNDLPVHGSWDLYDVFSQCPYPPCYFNGSVVVEGDGPIAAMASLSIL